MLVRRYSPILLPALSLGLFLAELFRGHGYERLGHPLAFALVSLAFAVILPLAWLVYARFLQHFGALARPAALKLDLLSYAPFLLLPIYFLPAVRGVVNAGSYLFFGAVGLSALLKTATLLYFRRATLAPVLTRPSLALGAIVVVAALFRLTLIATNRLVGDEALFAHWGLLIASGRDLFLKTEYVDKPPVFFYVVALFFRVFGPTETVARLPNVVSSLLGIVLVHEIARQLFDRRTALLSALFLAFSPFDILYAPTAYLDPLMVTLALAAIFLALRGHYLAAGLAMGLAAATKQTAVVFVPLWLLLAAVPAGKQGWKPRLARAGLELAAGSVAVGAAYLCWDFLVRVNSPKVLDVGRSHYGGFGLAPLASAGSRLVSWLEYLRYMAPSPLLQALLLAGLPCLLGYGLWRRRARPAWLFDVALAGFALWFLAFHTCLSFSLWDRYLLGLAPIVAILLARIALLPYDALLHGRPGGVGKAVYASLLALVLGVALLPPTGVALRYGYPIGSDPEAEAQGIEDVAAWFRGNAPPGSIIFHKYLGWQYSFYLFDAPVYYHHYTTPQFLLDLAKRLPDHAKYITFPSAVSPDELRACLENAGWELEELYRTYRADGTVSFTIYRIQPAP